jgi:hypothetical protein
MAKEEPSTCAKYAKDNDLLDKPGLKSLQRIASRTVKLAQMRRLQAKLYTQRRGPTYKFGILLPTDQSHALRIYIDNDHHLWELSLSTEMDQIDEYSTFRNMGRGTKPPRDDQRICVHFFLMSSMTCIASLVLLLVAI